MEKGQTITGERVGKYKQRTTIIAALNQGKVIAPFYFKGYTDNVVFMTWFRKCFLPELSQGKTVIMDNASFHKKSVIEPLINAAQAEVEKTAILNRPKTSSTNKMILILMDIIRLAFGIGAIGVFVMASLHYFYPQHFGNVLAYAEFSDAFFIILGFFFGERCVKKAWGN